MRKFLDEIQTHPLVVAIVVFVVIFVAYNVLKKPSTATGLPGGSGGGTGLAPGSGVGGPTGQEVYASQLYQYPTYTAPVVNQNAPPVPIPPATTPVSSTPVTAAPASASVYHGILSVVGSIHPANIGPWIGGRQVQVSGGTYTLNPGQDGRLYGMDKATGKQVLLWDGNDYAGGSRTTATVGGVL
jgi:hypothetical protein